MKRRSGPIRVAVIAPALAPAGGLCRWSRELVRSLEMVTDPDELTIDVLVRSRMDFTQQTIEQYGLRCRAHELPVGGTSKRDQLRSVRDTGRLMRQLKPDVVHVPLSWLWLLADRRFSRPKIIATMHGAPVPGSIHPQDRALARLLVARKKTRLVANAPSLRADLDQLVGVKSGTSISLPFATDPIYSRRDEIESVNLRRELGIDDDEAVVLTLSRLVPGKRVDLVLDVIDMARHDGRKIRFVICGDGPEFGPLVAEAERRQLEGWVHFLGHVGEAERLLLESDAVLHPSDSEGMPFALIEALLAGVPVVATRAGGTVDLIAEDTDGRLVDVGDASGLYRELCGVLDERTNPDKRAARSEAIFGLSAMADAHLRLVRELLIQGNCETTLICRTISCRCEKTSI